MLFPQLLPAVTQIFPDVLPNVTVIDVLPCPAVMTDPVGAVHVYEVAPLTAEME